MQFLKGSITALNSPNISLVRATGLQKCRVNELFVGNGYGFKWSDHGLCCFDLRTLFLRQMKDMSYVVYLPTMAATILVHDKVAKTKGKDLPSCCFRKFVSLRRMKHARTFQG